MIDISNRSAGDRRLFGVRWLRPFRSSGFVLLASIMWALVPASGQAQEEPRQKAFRELAIADSAWKQAQRLRQNPDFAEANSRDSGLGSNLERAQRLLEAARRGLKQAEQRQSNTGFNDSAVLAKRVTRQLEAYETRLRELWGEIEAERRPPPPPPPPPPSPPPAEPETTERPTSAVGVGEADVVTPEVVPPEAVPPETLDDPSSGVEPPGSGAVGSEAAGTASTVTAAETAPGGTVPETMTSPPARPAPAASEPPPTKPPPRRTRRGKPPLKLRQVADAFFTGDYQATINLVTAADFLDPEPRAHGLLFRGAARYALFLLGGETDYALRASATEDIAACRRDAPELSPSADAFSPRFRDFFAATR